MVGSGEERQRAASGPSPMGRVPELEGIPSGGRWEARRLQARGGDSTGDRQVQDGPWQGTHLLLSFGRPKHDARLRAVPDGLGRRPRAQLRRLVARMELSRAEPDCDRAMTVGRNAATERN